MERESLLDLIEVAIPTDFMEVVPDACGERSSKLGRINSRERSNNPIRFESDSALLRTSVARGCSACVEHARFAPAVGSMANPDVGAASNTVCPFVTGLH